MRRAAFELPAWPPGWGDSGIELIRIVDPLGDAIAWLAPDFGATCVGFAVRRPRDSGAEWTHVIHSGGAPALAGRPHGQGCLILSATPQHQPWPNVNDRPRRATKRHPWEFIERDPTAAVLETTLIPKTRNSEGRTSRETLRLRLAASLSDGALSLDVMAKNEGDEAAPVGLGLWPTFAAGLLGEQPSLVHSRHCPRWASSSEEAHDGSVVYLEGSDGDVSVGITLTAGIRHLAVHAPHRQRAVSLAVLGYTPSYGLMSLPPRASLRIAASISLLQEHHLSHR